MDGCGEVTSQVSDSHAVVVHSAITTASRLRKQKSSDVDASQSLSFSSNHNSFDLLIIFSDQALLCHDFCLLIQPSRPWRSSHKPL